MCSSHHTAAVRRLSPATCTTAPSILAVLSILAATAPAQRQFSELRKRALPEDLDLSRAVALGDLDGDGDLDAIIGNDGANRLYLNRGDGIFTDETASRLPDEPYFTRAVALGDVDGDGDLDIVLGNTDLRRTGAQNQLYENDGTGTFTDVTASRLPPDGDQTSAVALGDVDGDGDLDIVFGNSRHGLVLAQDRLYLNDGTGTFSDVTATSLPPDVEQTVAVALEDVDADGDLDLAFGDSLGNRLYLNDGAAHFVDVTATHLQGSSTLCTAVAFGDVDGDGAPDMMTGQNNYGAQLWRNDGTGHFTDVSTSRLPDARESASALAFGDLDGDGDLDVVLGSRDSYSFGRARRVFTNDGTGVFTDASASRMPADRDPTSALALGDVDGDGDLDLLSGISGYFVRLKNRLHLNDGSGTFHDATAPRLPANRDATLAIALGDVDGDGDLDLVLGNTGGYRSVQNGLYLNDGGRGAFVDVTGTRVPVQRRNTWALHLCDVDRDGDLDILCATQGDLIGEQNRLLLNDGTGRFVDVTATHLPNDADCTQSLAIGDVDGDGDPDVVFGNRVGTSCTSQNRLYLNDGNGRFADVTASNLPAYSDDTVGVALADVDGDGDLDIVCANLSRPNALYLNDGTGFFIDVTMSRLPSDGGATFVVVGDVDADGDPDLMFGIEPFGPRRNRLYRNDGTGTFTDVSATHMPVFYAETRAGELADIDGDGDLDAILLAPASFEQIVLQNDGTGHFTDVSPTQLPAGLNQVFALATGDIDGDGDLDAVFAGERWNRVAFNLRRQLDTPFLLRVGHSFTLDVYYLDVPPHAFPFALPFVSAGTATIPLPPLGTVGIDPARSVALPPVYLPATGGVGSVTVAVPADPGLVGATVYAQAVLVPYPFALRLTNVTADVAIR